MYILHYTFYIKMFAFFGTSPRSAVFLDQAIQNGLQVDLVVSAPPKPVGKKQILTENPVVSLAKKLNLSFLSNLSNLSDLKNLDIGLILDFNQIISNEIINLFLKGIINIHFSKLPQYRGPAPVQYTILNGDKEAWITYYLINEKLDAGQILTQTSLPLDLTENTETLYQKLIEKSAGEISGILENYTSGHLTPQLQDGPPSNTHKLTTENCKIDWQKSPDEIDRLIRAAYPEPTAWTDVLLHGNITQPSSRPNAESGGIPFPECKRKGFLDSARNDNKYRLKVLEAHIENGQLILDIVQLEGKNPVTWKQFQQGHPFFSVF